jgi:hypothetical protein
MLPASKSPVAIEIADLARAARSVNIAQQAFGAVDGSADGGVGARANCLERPRLLTVVTSGSSGHTLANPARHTAITQFIMQYYE